MSEVRPRRRKCRRPRFGTEQKALNYAVYVLREQGRTAYACPAHDLPTFHLRPKSIEKVVDTPIPHGA